MGEELKTEYLVLRDSVWVRIDQLIVYIEGVQAQVAETLTRAVLDTLNKNQV